jgi:hypothetical protein
MAAVEIDQVTINSMTLSPMATSQFLVGTSGGPRAGPTTIGQQQGLQIQHRWLLELNLELSMAAVEVDQVTINSMMHCLQWQQVNSWWEQVVQFQ